MSRPSSRLSAAFSDLRLVSSSLQSMYRARNFNEKDQKLKIEEQRDPQLLDCYTIIITPVCVQFLLLCTCRQIPKAGASPIFDASVERGSHCADGCKC